MPDDIPIARPVLKEPTVSRAPPVGRTFPCPACGARLEFDPNSRGLKCQYCGYDRKIDRGSPEEVPERDYQEYLEREEANGKAIPGRSSEVRCTGCGANVLLEDKVATEKCPFCATHLESQPEATHAMIPPESLLPFSVDLREARIEFSKWIESLWLAPNSLKKMAALGQLTGVYIPYWTYDAMTVTFYEGERGENYTDTVYVTDNNGRRVAQTVIRTHWYPVQGEVRHFFDDILLCSSKSIPPDLLERINAWNLAKLEPFRAEYLSGFRTERYAVGLRDGYKQAKAEMEPAIARLVRQDIGGDGQRVHEMRSRYSAVTFKPLLLPLWIAAYRYHDRPYQILVNGRTGKVAGYRPYSSWKIGFWVVVALVCFVTAFVLFLRAR
jgi:DNA-directed RNA polymerase subunit RPC12/RpoP